MIISELYTKIGQYTGYLSANADEKAKMLGAMNDVLKDFYNEFNLRSSLMDATFDTVDGTHTYYLDAMANKIVNMRETSTQNNFDCYGREEFEKNYPYPASTEEGLPTMYVPMRKYWVVAQPTSASVISIVSSSASDTSKVVVKGWASGTFVIEEVTLNGTTAVDTVNSYTKLLSISKASTTGTVTATSNSGAVTNISLQSWQTEKEYIEVRLHPIPDDEYTIAYTFYPKVYALQYDNELIPLPDKFVNVFEDCVIYKLFLQQGSNLADKWAKLVEAGKKSLQEMDYQSEEETPDFNFEELMY